MVWVLYICLHEIVLLTFVCGKQFELKGFTTSGKVSSFFVRVKSASSGSFHVNAFLVLVIFLRLVVQCARFGTKLASWLGSPKNALSSVLLLGRLNSPMAFSMFLSGYMPSLLMVCPAKLMVSPIWSFNFEIVRLMSWHLFSTRFNLLCRMGWIVWRTDENVVHDLFCPLESFYDQVWYSTPVVWWRRHAHWQWKVPVATR